MSSDTRPSGKNPLRSAVIFALVLAGWTGFNYWRAGPDMRSQCNDGSTNAITAEFCSCFAREAQNEINVLAYVPFIGRFMQPGDEEAERITNAAAMKCSKQLEDTIELVE